MRAERLMARLDEFTPQILANTVWAFARLGVQLEWHSGEFPGEALEVQPTGNREHGVGLRHEGCPGEPFSGSLPAKRGGVQGAVAS